jgi:hypothetical protein
MMGEEEAVVGWTPLVGSLSQELSGMALIWSTIAAKGEAAKQSRTTTSIMDFINTPGLNGVAL